MLQFLLLILQLTIYWYALILPSILLYIVNLSCVFPDLPDVNAAFQQAARNVLFDNEKILQKFSFLVDFKEYTKPKKLGKLCFFIRRNCVTVSIWYKKAVLKIIKFFLLHVGLLF